jgi:hypothetical protein
LLLHADVQLAQRLSGTTSISERRVKKIVQERVMGADNMLAAGVIAPLDEGGQGVLHKVDLGEGRQVVRKVRNATVSQHLHTWQAIARPGHE